MSHGDWRWLGAGLAGLVLANFIGGCLPHSCTDMGCIGKEVTVALVDEQGAAVAARGELRFEQREPSTFDCTVAPDASSHDIDCEQGVLQARSIYNRDDTLELRFQLEDGSFGEWQAVSLTFQRRVLKDFNGPDCDCTVFDATAMPVVVPEAARLP